MPARDAYENPLVTRYASEQMAALFSPRHRVRTWRRLWVMLAEAQRALGLPISAAQVQDLKRHVEPINWAAARRREREVRHDVMAHVHAFGLQAKKAAGIIHLGATSCFVTDNADLMILRDALEMTAAKTAAVVARLGDVARRHRGLPILGLTHLQPAQPTTLGKRASLWAQDFLLDLRELETRLERLPARGVKGTTGTQASFLALFDGDARKVDRLERMVTRKMGFARAVPVSGQTYTRKLDSQMLAALAGLAESAHKFATDLRLLAHRREVEEPFGKAQIGSSAMAYKRNPMRSERICALSRFLATLPANAYMTHATQWMERTLDDSANRRIVLPQAFLCADAVLELCADVAGGLTVHPKVIARNLAAELPFLATEDLLMAAVRAGGDRQQLHERIRRHARAAGERVRQGQDNDLLDRLRADPAFGAVAGELDALLDPARYIGRAPGQVDRFLREEVAPVRRRYARRARRVGAAVRV